MDHETVRELTAAYALDALDHEDERVVESHLRVCAECRAEVTAFTDTATALAYAVDAPAPSPALRDRIVAVAREDRPSNVVPFRARRLPLVATATLAAAAAVAAVAFGLRASNLSDELDSERAVLGILSDPGARPIALDGAAGRLIVARSGEAALVVDRLERAPEGRTYEIWIIRGERATPAGLFDGDEPRDVVPVQGNVPADAQVAVTVEREGGVDTPTGAPLFSARA